MIVEQKTTYYDILEIEREATREDVKRAYKRLVLRFHPDVCKDYNCDDKFKDIVKAYSILKDREQREQYDKTIKNNSVFSPKIRFDAYYSRIIEKAETFWEKIHIFFKNITGTVSIPGRNREKDCPIAIPDEILQMSVYELEERLEYSTNEHVCVLAAGALGFRKERRSFYVLKQKLGASSERTKRIIIWALGNLGMKNALSVLNVVYKSSSVQCKTEVLRSYYKICEGSGTVLFKMLLTAMTDPDDSVKKEALTLFLQTKKKLYYRDILPILENTGTEIKSVVDRLIKENRIIQ